MPAFKRLRCKKCESMFVVPEDAPAQAPAMDDGSASRNTIEGLPGPVEKKIEAALERTPSRRKMHRQRDLQHSTKSGQYKRIPVHSFRTDEWAVDAGSVGLLPRLLKEAQQRVKSLEDRINPPKKKQ